MAESVFRAIASLVGVAGLTATTTSSEFARAGHPHSKIRHSTHARRAKSVRLSFDGPASAGRAGLTRTTPQAQHRRADV
ncbi:MAG: hypothetical protein ACREXM_04065 [Gammaproteobacteria bacterium]